MTEEMSLEERMRESVSRGIPQTAFTPSANHSTPTTPSEQTKRTTPKQRRATMEEYKHTFLVAPKIIDRQPIFISRDLRDKVDVIVRRLGERKMSVSGFVENILQQHLEQYAEDIEQWKRL